MNLALVVSVAIGLLSGAVVALRFIAPKTSSTVDDSILARLEALEKIAEQLLPKK
jgi:hypothetical protein